MCEEKSPDIAEEILEGKISPEEYVVKLDRRGASVTGRGLIRRQLAEIGSSLLHSIWKTDVSKANGDAEST